MIPPERYIEKQKLTKGHLCAITTDENDQKSLNGEAMKENLKKIHYKRILAAMLVAALIATGIYVPMKVNKKQAMAEEYKNTDAENAMENIVETVAGVKKVGDSGLDKEETVYIIADAAGNPTEIVASEWLKNLKGSDKIEDVSTLKDISNVKGYEEYKAGSNDSLTWDAKGNDIYYQGTPTTEVPVGVKVSFKLDGKEISPEELKGKSGRVEIRFDYENKTNEVIEINGEEEHVNVPFTMLTGLILPTDKFSNVEADNARLISEGNNVIAVGYAFPGLYQSLKYDDFKDNLPEDKKDKAEDLDISDHVVITADVEDFEMASTMTVALPDVLKEVSLTENIDTDEIQDDMDELADATDELIDGTSELLDGVYELKDGTSELRDGTSELRDAGRDIKDGTEDIYEATGDMADGARDIKDGICEAYGGTKKLYDGSKKLYNGTSTLDDGAEKLGDGVNQMVGMLSNNQKSMKTLQTLAETLTKYMQEGASGSGSGSKAGASSASQSVSDDAIKEGAEEQEKKLAESLIQMDRANDLALASVSQLSIDLQDSAISQNGAEDQQESSDFDEEELADDFLYSVRDTSEMYKTVSETVGHLVNVIEDRREELAEEKDGLEKELEELGEPDPKPEEASDDGSSEGEDDETSDEISSNEIEKNDTADAAEYYKNYYRDYYEKYYRIQVRLESLDDEESLLLEISEHLDEISLSVNGISEELAEEIDGFCEKREEKQDTQDEEESVSDNSATSLVQSVVDSYEANRQAKEAVWEVVYTLKLMNVIESSLTEEEEISSLALDAADMSSMTPEQFVAYLQTMDVVTRNQFLGQMLQDPSSRVQVAAILASLPASTRKALQISDAVMSGAEKVLSAAVASGAATLTSKFTSSSTKEKLSQLSAGAGTLMDGAGELREGAKDLKNGVWRLREGMRELDNGGVKLYDGALDLKDGAKDLDDGAGDLKDGIVELDDGAAELDDGVEELVDGVTELHDGVIEFNDEGIQKLIDLFGDNVTDMLDRIDEIQQVGAGYQSFSGKNSDAGGSVKFILKTEEIREED